jgi:hypothetical protein
MSVSIFFTAAMIRAFRHVKNIDALILTRVWQELDYCIDMCRDTCDAHIENL